MTHEDTWSHRHTTRELSSARRRPPSEQGPGRGAGTKLIGRDRLVHDDPPEAEEGLRSMHRLGEEVGDVVGGPDERDLDLEGLDHVAHEEVSPLDVLHALVLLRVVGDVARGLSSARRRNG